MLAGVSSGDVEKEDDVTVTSEDLVAQPISHRDMLSLLKDVSADDKAADDDYEDDGR